MKKAGVITLVFACVLLFLFLGVKSGVLVQRDSNDTTFVNVSENALKSENTTISEKVINLEGSEAGISENEAEVNEMDKSIALCFQDGSEYEFPFEPDETKFVLTGSDISVDKKLFTFQGDGYQYKFEKGETSEFYLSVEDGKVVGFFVMNESEKDADDKSFSFGAFKLGASKSNIESVYGEVKTKTVKGDNNSLYLKADYVVGEVTVHAIYGEDDKIVCFAAIYK